MEKLKKQILGFKNWDASKKGRALNRLKGENLERFTGLPDDVLQAALDDELSAGAQDALETVHAKLDALKEDYPINTDAPLYSHFLARTMNMTAPYEQYTFWLAGFSSCAVAVVQLGKGMRHLTRARELGRAFAAKRQNKPEVEVQLHLANAEAQENQLLRVEAFERQQRSTAATRFAVAAASPLLWAAYVAYRRKMSLDAAQQPQQRQHQTKQPPQQTTKGLQKS